MPEDAAQDVVTVTPEHRKVEDATQDVVTVTLEHQKVRMRVVQPSLCPQTRAVWPLWPRWVTAAAAVVVAVAVATDLFADCHTVWCACIRR